MITNAVHGEGISHYDIKNVNLVEMDTIIRERDKVRKCRMSFKTNKKEYLKAEDYDLIDAILSKICNGAYVSQENSILTFLDNLKKFETEMEKTPQVPQDEEDCDRALVEECYWWLSTPGHEYKLPTFILNCPRVDADWWVVANYDETVLFNSLKPNPISERIFM